MQSEPQNKDDLNKEWANFFALQCKRVSDPAGFSLKQYRDELIPVIRKILQYKGIDIKNLTYKDDVINYQTIKNEQIQEFPGGSMSLEEFIERFLLDRNNGCYYISLYEMGNPVEFPKSSDYSDESVADDIACLLYPSADGADQHEHVIAILNTFGRKGGLNERIKKYLKLDLDSFNKPDLRSKRERCKILHFFYLLEHKSYDKKNVLKLLDNPSMENVDNTFLGWQTHNGKIVRTVKESLGKELSLEEKDRVYSTIANISLAWDNILDNVRLLLDFLYDYGFDYNSVEPLQLPIPTFESDEGNRESTYQYPVERLYLTISQREYLGNLLDIAFVNDIQNGNNYDVPPELVEEMKSLRHTYVDFNDAEKYIDDNALRLSRYVYLGRETTRADVQRICTYTHKLQKLLNFCYRANCRIDIREISDELQIVSFLQALILDNQSEKFDYIYYGYQNQYKKMMSVQSAPRGDKHVPDALQVYWVRKVTDRWYANVGKYDVRLKLRQIEQTCDEIRKQILSQPTLDKMIAAHNFYMEQADHSFFGVENQIQAVSHVVNFLHDLGFMYEDHECKIRYAFLDSEDCDAICDSILLDLQIAIQDCAPTCQIECEATGTAMKDAGFSLELLFDYCEKVCILTRFNLIFG